MFLGSSRVNSEYALAADSITRNHEFSKTTTQKKMQEISKIAREKLKLFSEIEDIKSLSHPEHVKLGSHEGVAILTVAASFPMTDSQEDYEIASKRAVRLIDNIMGLISTALVVGSVTLTISLTIFAMSVTTFKTGEPSIGSLLIYVEWEKSGIVLQICYFIQQTFLAFAIGFGIRIIMIGFLLYGCIGIYTITLDSQFKLLLQYLAELSDLWVCVASSVLFLGLSLPFMAVRISPASTFLSVIPLIFIYFSFSSSFKIGDSYAVEQHRVVQEILKTKFQSEV